MPRLNHRPKQIEHHPLAMAFPHPAGLLPAEVAFLCEMEQVTIIPRQRLERLDLLGVSRSQDLRNR